MKRLRILTFIFLVIASGIFLIKSKSPSTVAINGGLIQHTEWLVQHQSNLTPEEDQRTADQTFLTYPEWFLVHSPAEQAAYFKSYTSTSFPFQSHIDQIWDSYSIISNQIAGYFPYNNDYHVMIKVIGSSASVEYKLKSWYELVIGRLTNRNDSQVLTEEDQFNYTYTQAYVDFIREIPWYEFDFKGQLVTLWSETDFFGPHFLRKLERKYLLTSELIVKMAYGKLIKLGTRSLYDPALLTTVVVVDKLPSSVANESNIAVLQELADGSAVLRVPRYAAFNPTAVKFAQEGVNFIEIAGNNSAILLTVLVPLGQEDRCDDLCEVLFIQPIQSDGTTKRMALVTPVTNLSNLLVKLKQQNIVIEHIYDY